MCCVKRYGVKNNNKPNYYHFNCKCKTVNYNLRKVNFEFPIEKITKYLFVDTNKKAMMKTMGYYIKDYQELYDLIQKEVEDKFLTGNYILKVLNQHGQHFTVKIVVQGKREHKNEYFNCHVGCVAWPFGKIKIATPLLKD